MSAADLEAALRARLVAPPDPGSPAHREAWRAQAARLTAGVDAWAPAFAAAGAAAHDAAQAELAALAGQMAGVGPAHADLAAGLPMRAQDRMSGQLGLWLSHLAEDYPGEDVDWAYAGHEVGRWYAQDLPVTLGGLVWNEREDGDGTLLLDLLADVAGGSGDELAARLAAESAACAAAGPALWGALGFVGEPPSVEVLPGPELGFFGALNGRWQPERNRVALSRDVLLARMAAAHPALPAGLPGGDWGSANEPCLALLRTALQAPGHVLLHELAHAGMPELPAEDELGTARGSVARVRGLSLLGKPDPEIERLFGPILLGASSALHEAFTETAALAAAERARSAAPEPVLWDIPATVPAFDAWGAPLVGYPDGPRLIAGLAAAVGFDPVELMGDGRQASRVLDAAEIAFDPSDAAAFRAWYLDGSLPADCKGGAAGQLRYWRKRLRA